jgi:hypothetical protein
MTKIIDFEQSSVFTVNQQISKHTKKTVPIGMEPSVQHAGNRVNMRLYIGAEAVMTDLVRSNKKRQRSKAVTG